MLVLLELSDRRVEWVRTREGWERDWWMDHLSALNDKQGLWMINKGFMIDFYLVTYLCLSPPFSYLCLSPPFSSLSIALLFLSLSIAPFSYLCLLPSFSYLSITPLFLSMSIALLSLVWFFEIARETPSGALLPPCKSSQQRSNFDNLTLLCFRTHCIWLTWQCGGAMIWREPLQWWMIGRQRQTQPTTIGR